MYSWNLVYSTINKIMSFGPFTLIRVYEQGSSLILDLANEHGEIVHKPKRYMSRYGHDNILIKAKKLEGKSVVTTTDDSRRFPPDAWWIDVDEYWPLESKEMPPSISKTQNESSISPISKSILPVDLAVSGQTAVKIPNSSSSAIYKELDTVQLERLLKKYHN